ncbi:ABC transporter permease [Methylobacterium organophilum]|uniref:Glutathione transport system permease protein GsiD n=1 Tax=Methylobacterium organophilum TaxID=410 RepID=A0ABQ4T7G9_METOR|nr:ABC transporter permease [Methylobacterium organophilum]GJE27612.1 Glutathione transport system permease protein GsiD [Methylobacterium organophilum]
MRALLALRHRPLGSIGGLVVLFWLVCALLAPWLAPHDPLHSFVPLQTPLSRGSDGTFFLLGTDILGRDIFARLIYGARSVVIWSGLATGTAYLLGIATGLVAGFYRGPLDRALSFGANVILSFPILVLYLVVITRFGASGLNIILAVTFASSPAIFRIVRALTLDMRTRDFVEASVTQGESGLRIMAIDILPNVTGPLVVDACLRLGYTAITIGVLGFLGLGLPPPTPDWGGMVNEGRSLAIAFPHLILFPCIAISSLMLGLSLLADALREGGRGPVSEEVAAPAVPV